MSRRNFLQSMIAAVAASSAAAFSARRSPRILLRSSWQTVNIGDVGHTPGVLALLETHLPDAELFLWPSDIGRGVEPMLRKRFPGLVIVQGKEAISKAIADCDFFLHGSGPSLVAAKDLARWHEETGKPYGIYGITVSTLDPPTVALLSGSKFSFFRDSVSLRMAIDHGVKAPIMEFAPDGAFAVDLRDDGKAEAYLNAHGLERGRFFCCIPRLRNTPYWLIKDRPFDAGKDERNRAMKEHDHAPIRQAIIALIRQTDFKVLVCPEDASQMAVGKEMLIDPLPDDVKARVVGRETFWLTDEAISTYVRSAGIFGLEMHSPIMALGNGVPAIVCRFREQTSKGFMWRDIGLDEWLFDLDGEPIGERLTQAVLSIAKDPVAASRKVGKALDFVHRRQRGSMKTLESSLRV